MCAPLVLTILVAQAVVVRDEPQVLNNLVTELLRVESGGVLLDGTFGFDNPRDGWVYVASTTPANRPGRAAVAIDGNPVHTHQTGGTLESMRFLLKGPHEAAIATDGKTGLKRLVVRAIPELVYSKFGADPHVQEYGKYDWAFLSRYVLPNINVLVGSGGGEQKPYLEQWKRQGGLCMVECGVPGLGGKEPVTAEEAEKYWSQHVGLADPLLDGVIADEFLGTDARKYSAWSEALRRIRANEKLKSKRFYPYWATTYDAAPTRAFLQVVTDAGWALAWERYLPEQRDEAAAREYLDTHLRRPIAAWRKAAPGIERHLIICLGTFSQPPESLDIDPGVNYKVYLDMQMNLLANDPAGAGLYGVMTYLSSYTDEETVRWMGKLFRHYCIEGNTKPFTSDPHRLGHIRNADFEEGLAGWTVNAAEPGSVAAKTMDGFSWLQGRYPETTQGNTVLWMKRSGQRPNRVSQAIKDLKPGRLYSLKMFSGDFRDLSARQKHAIAVELTNVEVLRDKSFQHVFPSCYSHHWGPFNDKKPAWMNYHWIVFRAKGTEGTLSISDWLTDREPGGPTGQELMMNFVEIQPYEADELDVKQERQRGT
jgi:hypothetical protein